MAPDRSVEATIGGQHDPTAVEVGSDGTIYLADTYADVVRTYTFGSTPTPDTTAPTGAYTAPGSGSTVPVGEVTISGTAADDRSVEAAYVGLRRNDDNTWLHADGSWGAFQWLPAELADPGASTTGWEFTRALPVTGGYYSMLRVDDAAGNQNVTPRPFLRFTAAGGGTDSATPREPSPCRPTAPRWDRR